MRETVQAPPLQADLDVAIVGAGFTGLSTAIHLDEAGAHVGVFDAVAPGWGASGRNGGQVIPGLKDDPAALEARFGPEIGGQMAETSGAAPALPFDLVEPYGIDCDLQRAGWIQPAHCAIALATVQRRVRDPRHLGARIGMTSVLHSWGSAMTHHPHVHVIVAGGGLSPDGARCIACRPGFFLPVKVLSRRFRRLFLEALVELHRAGKLSFFGGLSELADSDAFAAHLAPLRKTDSVVYAKPPFGGPEAVLAYLSRYTHRVAISNHRLVSADAGTVAFRWKDYRIKRGDRMKVMRLPTAEFIRRFLIHVLPSGFHRIGHAGFLANGVRRNRINAIRRLIETAPQPKPPDEHSDRNNADESDPWQRCPQCGGPMHTIETFTRGQIPKSRAPPCGNAA